MRYFPENPMVVEGKELHNLLLLMKRPFDLYLNAKPFDLVEGYRLISDFQDHLLAAKLSSDGELHFTTWEYSYDHTGVILGHYYEQNYQEALCDYRLRSGLVDKNEQFNKEEWMVLHDACVFRGRCDNEISYDEEKKLNAVLERIAEKISDEDVFHLYEKKVEKQQTYFRRLNLQEGMEQINAQANFFVFDINDCKELSFEAISEKDVT